jgi:curli biogenesis system outer membrane secretion channel CsgG
MVKVKSFILGLLVIFLLSACGETTSKVRKDEKIAKLRDYETEKTFMGPKRRIAVASFKNETRFGDRRLGNSVTDVFVTELSKTGRFTILERESVDKLLQETNFSSTLGQGTVAAEQQFLDADYIITGAVTKYGVNTVGKKKLISSSKEQKAEVSVDVKMVDVRTGEVLFSETGEGVSTIKYGTTLGVGTSGGYDESLEQEAFRASAIKVMDNIIETVDKRPWSAAVVKFSGDKIYINSGMKSNLKIGAKLNVYRFGDKIEYKGQFLGYEEEKVGTAIIVDYLGEDASIAAYNGKSFRAPGIVKLED